MMQVIIITGPVNSGKTTFLRDFVEKYGKLSDLSGIISSKIVEESVLCYSLGNIRSGEKRFFISSSPRPDWMQYGRFYFNPQVFAWGNKIIKSAGKDTILIIDEIGPVELNGGGFRPGLDQALQEHEGSLVITVRQRILEDIGNIIHSAGHDVIILPPEDWKVIADRL